MISNARGKFLDNLPDALWARASSVERRLIREYGSVFAAEGVSTPPVVVFETAEDVELFQSQLDRVSATIGGFEMTLQAPAMHALLNACDAAGRFGLTISPRGPDSAARDHVSTVELWASRVEPALDHWRGIGAIDESAVSKIRSLPPFEQLEPVLELEERGIFFAKDLSKSILYSVAPPGASQHLALLAFDVAEFNNADVRRILARNYWYQTVTSDLPHFTYLGIPESELPSRGLKRIEASEREFWVPDIE